MKNSHPVHISFPDWVMPETSLSEASWTDTRRTVNNGRHLKSILLLCAFALCMTLSAQDWNSLHFTTPLQDSVYEARVMDTVSAYFRKHPWKLPKEKYKVKITPSAGVFYSQERSAGLAAGVSGQYGPNLFSLLTSVSVTGSTTALIAGSYNTRGHLLNIEYSGGFNYLPVNFWGIGFEQCNNSANKSKYTEKSASVHSAYLFRAGRTVRLGPTVGFEWSDASKFTSDSLIAGYPRSTVNFQGGVKFVLDTRDNTLSPRSGWYAVFEPVAYVNIPDATVSFRGTIIIDAYAPLWKGGTAAFDFYFDYSSRNASWLTWGRLGGDVRLRGYYKGRYIDRNSVFFQAELRQVIYKMHSAVAWIGAGNVFGEMYYSKIENTLPTFGVGYRLTAWGTVFRFDAGFGRDWQWALSAGIGHTF